MSLTLIRRDPDFVERLFTLAARVVFIAIGVCIIVVTLTFLRLASMIKASHSNRPPRRSRSSTVNTHLLVVLGSGGHTSEMLSMLSRARICPKLYTHRTYIVSSGDGFSAQKAKAFEESLNQRVGHEKSLAGFEIISVPRARKIHQSLLTTPISSTLSLISCIKLLYNHPAGYPDLILTNGPGTGVVVVIASLILRFFAIQSKISGRKYTSSHKAGDDRIDNGQMRTIFIESWARVRTLSLSGKILLPIVDRFLVQWKGLEGIGQRADYAGFLI